MREEYIPYSLSCLYTCFMCSWCSTNHL